MNSRRLHWLIHGTGVDVRIEDSGNTGAVYIDAESHPFVLLERTAHSATIEVDGEIHRVYMASDPKGMTVWCDGRTFRLERGSSQAANPDSNSGTAMSEVHSSMPGKVIRIDVKTGDAVKEGQALLTMESMKMETTLFAEKAGSVTDVRVETGQVVDVGELLLKIE